MPIKALTERLEAIEKKVDRNEDRLVEVLASLVGLQRNALRLLGGSSLLGACLIFALSRMLGL